MTCIITGVKTKKHLKEAIRSFNLNPQAGASLRILIEDPSILNPRRFHLGDMQHLTSECVTNHPLRSWFAIIRRSSDGTFSVE